MNYVSLCATLKLIPFQHDERAQELVEYSLLALCLGLASIAGFHHVAVAVVTVFSNFTAYLQFTPTPL